MVIINKILKNIILNAIKLYIIISSTMNITHRCRFYPSCSIYAYDALSIHGITKGCILVFYRLIRCNPFCKGGVEYVPLPSKKYY